MERRIEQHEERWVEVDAWGQRLAGKRGALDLEIGEWLLAVRDEEVHRRLGFASLAEYVERRLGLEPHATSERIRVAGMLGELRMIRDGLARGALSFSAARELTRVAIPETEEAWIEAAVGLPKAEVERLVAGRRPGQLPTDPADPRLVRKVLRLELSAESYALWRESVKVIQKAVDPRLSEEEVFAEIARQALGGPIDEGRSPYQIALVECPQCGKVSQDARGEEVDLPAEVLERARCDAQEIGRVDKSPGGRSRATQTIPPAVRRQVLRRDHGRCRVPGCANACWVDVHHVWLRSEGGGHDPDRLLTLCGAHHRRLHEGILYVEGETERDVRFFHADGTEYGRMPDAAATGVMAEAYTALRSMGFKETETKRALAHVRSPGGPAELEAIVREALTVLTAA